MAHADEAALQRLLPLLRQLRAIPGLREMKAGGSGFDRYPVDAPPGQRKLVDDAKRRVSRSDED